MAQQAVANVRFTKPVEGAYAGILKPESVTFLAGLSGQFEPRRRQLLAKRAERWEELRQGALPDFLESTFPGVDARDPHYRVQHQACTRHTQGLGQMPVANGKGTEVGIHPTER